MSPALIHIGYHKTASSWLQREVFPAAERAQEISYVAGPHHRNLDLHSLFFKVNSFAYDEDRVRSELEPGIEEARARGLVPVISHERFSGGPYSGGHDSKQTAERMHALFPTARILMVIREQSDMLLSMYKQYIQAGGGASFGQFVTPRNGAGSIASFRLDYLEYHRLISHYQNLFGRDNVLVLPYELLKRRPDMFLAEIGAFCGANLGDPPDKIRKKSRSAPALYLERHANRIFSLTGLNPAPMLQINDGYVRVKRLSRRFDRKIPRTLKKRMDSRWKTFSREVTGNRYRDSNARTAQLTGLNLASFGYQTIRNQPSRTR